MNKQKINWGILLLIIVTGITVIWTTISNVKDRSFNYGKEFNKKRDSLGIPRIEDNWITHENNKWRRYWTHRSRGVNSNKPMHLGKTSNFKGDTLISEEDDFHYEKTDSLSYRVIYRYQFDSAKWNCRLIEYSRREYLETSSTSLTLVQADSILNYWKLTRSHKQ